MSSTRRHRIKSTICGAVCDGTNTQIGNSIAFCSNSIMRHLNNCNHCKQCYKPHKKPNMYKVTKEMQSQIESIHNRIATATPTGVLEIVRSYLPHEDLSKKTYTCKKCLYSCDKRERFNNHISCKTSKCKGYDFFPVDEGTQFNRVKETDKIGIAISIAALQGIANGSFVLPWKKKEKEQMPQHNVNINSIERGNNREATMQQQILFTPQRPMAASGGEGPTPTQGGERYVEITQPQLHTTATPQNVVTPTLANHNLIARRDELDVILNSHYRPVATNRYNFAVQELTHCFGNEHTSTVLPHLNTFSHRIDESGPPLQSFLEKGTQQMNPTNYDHTQDKIELKILLLAGEKWFQSQAANNHVRALMPDIRSKLYNIGTTSEDGADNEDELLRGKTFVPTKEVGNIITVFKHFMIYLNRIGWEGIQPQMQQIEMVTSNGSLNEIKDEGEWHNSIAAKIVDINIIPGILMSVTLAKPPIPNGYTVVQDFIAIRSISVNRDGKLALRSGNKISKEMNTLLRLSRHGAASYYSIVQNRMRRELKTDDDFRSFVFKSIAMINSSSFTHSCCTAIRRGREISNKTPSNVYKAHDPVTGEVMVGKVIVPKMIWSRAIPSVLELIRPLFLALFPAHNLLDRVLDTTNTLCWAGVQTKVRFTMGDETVHTTQLNEVIPNLAVKGAQQLIEKIWQSLKGAMYYLSSGATRGEEGGRLRSIDHWRFYFNMLRFQTFSLKNETHGQQNNTMLDRYMSPTLSRYTTVAFVCLFPAVESHESLTLPEDGTATDAADKAFALFMNLKQPQGPKTNRDIVGVLANLNFPKHRRRGTTTNAVARQFSHSSAIHEKYYSSEEYIRSDDRSIMNSGLLVAREFHAMFGEPKPSYDQSAHISRGPDNGVDREMLIEASQFAYNNSNARPTALQIECILTLDDLQNRKNVIVLAGCGTGKSGLYIQPMVARALTSMSTRKTLVISPHNPLLCQHHNQALQYLRGLNRTVASIESVTDLDKSDFPREFDICFIAIHAFAKLVQSNSNVIDSWNLNMIFVDEIHLMYSERFRVATSWISLHNLSRFGAKIVCMSASISKALCTHIQSFLQMGDTAFVGDPESSTHYKIPDIAIHIVDTEQGRVMNDVVNHVKTWHKRLNRGAKRAIHIVTRSRDQAVIGADACNEADIPAIWMTSKCTREDRQDKMKKYSEQEITAIWTTYDVGYDSPLTCMVVIMEGPSSTVSFIQAAGRIRPMQQRAQETKGMLGQVWVFKSAQGMASTNIENVKGDVSVMTRYGLFNGDTTAPRDIRLLYMALFTNSKIKNILNGNNCLRREIYGIIGIRSDNCRLCSACKAKDNLTIQQNISRGIVHQQNSDKELVTYLLQKAETECIVCSQKNCTGRTCLGRGDTCHKCFASSCIGSGRNNTNKCAFARPTIQGACVYCWLPQYLRRGEFVNDHGIEICIHKQRIKRIMLHECGDGQDAKNKLEGCWEVEQDFVRIFATNYKTIMGKQRKKQRRT